MKITYKKDEIVVRIPIASNDVPKLSKSGKTRVLATTNGFIAIPGGQMGEKISINVIVPARARHPEEEVLHPRARSDR